MAQSRPVHPHDRTRFVRLSLVIIEELTPLLQDILQNEILPNQIFMQVSRHKSLFQMLRAEQITLIQNAQNDGYKKFDITLTYMLLRNLKCLKVTAPTQGWGTSQMPGNGETTLGDDIERIRLIRNSIYGHITLPSLSDTEFQEHWSNISDICKRMEILLGKGYVQRLQTAEVHSIDQEMENTYLEKIKILSIAEKSTRDLLQEVIQDRVPCVEEIVRIDVRNPLKRKRVETLTATSVSILNCMMNSITEGTSDSEIELLYKSVEEFIRENKEDKSTLASFPIFEELEQKITGYASLKTNKMQILSRFLRFTLRLKKKYGAELESSEGSLLLKLTFSSERCCELYMQDFETGEIGKLILDVLIYPPYLANFDLLAEDLMIYLNDMELTTERMWTDETPTSEMRHSWSITQEVVRCDVCEIFPLESNCELCTISLCVNCKEKHLLDCSRRHDVMPFVRRKSTHNYTTCPDHVDEHCEHYCEKCDIPVCSICISSGKHKGHGISDILEKCSAKTENLRTDLEELETRIYPLYEKIASDVQADKAELEMNYGKLTKSFDQQGDILHQEITAIVKQRKSAIQEMKNQHLNTLNKSTDGITQKIKEIKQNITGLKSILKSNDVYLTSTYKSRNSEFRALPLQVRVALPKFSPPEINKDQLNQMFSPLPALSINTERGDTSHGNPLHDESRLLATTYTNEHLLGVSCLSEDQFWTRGESNIMKLRNIQGELLASMKTKSGNKPHDIAVTYDGYLVYTDYDDRTVNLARNEQIQSVITLQDWYPLFVCNTDDGDLLVTMVSDDRKESKVVRYSGSTATQTIQFDDQGHPLYSSDVYSKCVSENRNRDICVADSSAVVVVNKAGKLRFRYTGHPPNTKTLFYPVDITTDSQSHILTSDWYNDRIHILYQDGQFLRYIHNVRFPFGLSVDIRDNLFVAEYGTAKVKKIQYQ